MNITRSDAGSISERDILENGFRIDEVHTYSDMGQGWYTLTDYSKDEKLFLTGGYWRYYLKDKKGKILFEGWWNTREEFENTLKSIYMGYMSEAAKVRDMLEVMKYITGEILDVGCGPDKIIPSAIGVDGRALQGVDVICELDMILEHFEDQVFDTVFSSHYLEHCRDQFGTVEDWAFLLKPGGHLVLYLPDGRHYNNQENPEHMIDMNYDQFMFWFKRSFCGEGKTFKGTFMPKYFELVAHGMDVGEDRYSFYVIARKV